MRINRMSIVVLILISFAAPCVAQHPAVPFLLLPPSAEANGMGVASVANPTDDPLAVMANPAQLGMLSRPNSISSGYDHTDWMGLSVFKYSAYAVNAGLDLRRISGNALPLTIGVGYSRVTWDLGDLILDAPFVPNRIKLWESSDQYSIGIGYDHWVKVSGGMTVKVVRSHMPAFTDSSIVEATGKGTLFDYGFLVDVPLAPIASKLAERSFEIAPGLSPYVDWSIGLARTNLGQQGMTYLDAAQSDPFPRYASIGMGFELGLMLNQENDAWKPLSLKWMTEAGDLLVDGRNNYKSGLGDIKFFDEVMLGRMNAATEKRRGWEADLLEIASIRTGVSENSVRVQDQSYGTSGWSFRFAGIPKLLRSLNVPIGDDTMVGFIANHIDIRYTASTWKTRDLSGQTSETHFDSVNLSFAL